MLPVRNADGGGVQIFGKKRYEGVRFNVICVTREWMGVQFPGKKRYVTLEWSLKCHLVSANSMYVSLNAFLLYIQKYERVKINNFTT